MTVTLDDIQRRESRHVLQTYKRQPVAFVRGSGSRLYDVDGREYLDFVSGIGVASLGHAHPGLAAAIADQACDAAAHVEPVLPPVPGGGGRAAVGAVRTRARVLLQQRHRSDRGVPEVRAALLVHAGRRRSRPASSRSRAAFAGRTMGALSVTYDEHYRAPFLPLLGPVTFVDPATPEALAAAVTDRTAAIIAEPIQGEGGIRPLSPEFAARDHRRLPTHRHAADRRRSADRARTHRLSVLLPGARLAAGPDLGRQGARRRRAGRRGAGVGARRRDDLARRSRQHLRRQPARHPRRGVLPRAADGPRPARSREDRRRSLRAPAAHARAASIR